MTMEDDISWSQLLKHPIATAEHSNDNNRIAAATETLQQTAHQFVKVLNERAMLLANSAQFDAALHDAAATRTLIPGSGIGYLCMGDVYCQQGHHAAAISIYDQGLEAVPESDPYYQQLQQHRMTAIANNSKRVDFISQLPLDIVITHIVPRMQPRFYSESSCEILYVSREWQERIFQQSKGLKFSFGEEANTFKEGHAQLIQFAPHVQFLGGSLLDVRLDELFSRASFSNLKELSIICAPTTPRLPLIHGLQMVADSLTHLSLYECPGLQLRDIVETCPNLVSLETMNVDAIVPSSSSSTYPKVTHLALHAISETARSQHDNMVDILGRFPSLQSLKITPMPSSSILSILHQCCPHLQILHYGLRSSFSDDIIDVHPNGNGVTFVSLGANEEDIFNQDDVIGFLHVHIESLEKFTFRGIMDANNSYWRLANGKVRIQQVDDVPRPHSRYARDPTLPQAFFMRLDSIMFTGPELSSCHEFILWMISNAPNLNTIRLRKSYFQLDIANAMINARHLCKLEIFHSWGNGGDEGIERFLGYHIETMGSGSTLEEVIIRVVNLGMSRTPWIRLLARLKCLRNLKLLAGSISEDCIPVMEEIGQGCPALKELTLGHADCGLPDDLFKSLCKHPNLECLRIGAESLSNDDLMDLCAFKNLKQLHLPSIVEDDMLEMLQDHIPKVELIDDDDA